MHPVIEQCVVNALYITRRYLLVMGALGNLIHLVIVTRLQGEFSQDVLKYGILKLISSFD